MISLLRRSPELHIEVTESRVRISGLVSSFAHEAILRQTLLQEIRRQGTRIVRFDGRAGTNRPGGRS